MRCLIYVTHRIADETRIIATWATQHLHKTIIWTIKEALGTGYYNTNDPSPAWALWVTGERLLFCQCDHRSGRDSIHSSEILSYSVRTTWGRSTVQVVLILSSYFLEETVKVEICSHLVTSIGFQPSTPARIAQLPERCIWARPGRFIPKTFKDRVVTSSLGVRHWIGSTTSYDWRFVK